MERWGSRKGIKTVMRPAPVDFAEIAAEMIVLQIMQHWRTDHKTARRWISEQSPEWQARKAEICRENRAAAGRKNIAIANAARWTAPRPAKLPKLVQVRKPRPMPDGFADFAAIHGVAACKKQFRANENTIRGWIALLPPEWHLSRAEKKAAAAADRKRARAERGYAARRSIAPPKASKPAAKSKKAGGSVSPVNWGFNKPAAAAPVPGGTDQRACDFLKRHFWQAFNAERVHGKQWKGLFVVGSKTLKADEVIALAREYGFNPDGWRSVVAPGTGEARA